MIILGHPETLFTTNDLPKGINPRELEEVLQLRWRDLQITKLPCLAHLNTVVLLRHLLTILSQSVLTEHSDKPLRVELVHLHADKRESRIPSSGICFFNDKVANVTARYREVTLSPFRNLEGVRRYQLGLVPCQFDDDNDEALVQQLVQQSSHLVCRLLPLLSQCVFSC